MSTPMSTVDPADEAGGEVIYSSDGLAPIQVSKPYNIVQQHPEEQVLHHGDDEVVLDSEAMSPESAFEVFQGKVYYPSAVAGKPVNAFVVHNKNDESALEKLARLQLEVSELEKELRTTAADSGQFFDEQVVKIATDLKVRLVTASSTKIAEQDELTRMIRAQRQQLQSEPKDSSATSIGSPEKGLVYELYGNASSNPTTSLEERLLKLERLLGNSQSQFILSSSSTAKSSSHKTLLNRLEDMETLVSTVDATSLEQSATKAKVIRADLEAASKARNKLTATYKKEDSKMIQQLYQQMVDLEGLSGYLPSLVDRLQQLSSLHQQSTTFANRLDELERGATQLESSVGQLESGMTILQQTMVQNIATMESNLQKLDEKL